MIDNNFIKDTVEVKLKNHLIVVVDKNNKIVDISPVPKQTWINKIDIWFTKHRVAFQVIEIAIWGTLVSMMGYTIYYTVKL